MRRVWMALALFAGLVVSGCGKDTGGGDADTAAMETPAADVEPITGEPTREVAVVNGESVTLGDVNRVVAAWRSGRFPQIDLSMSEGQLQRRALEELINQNLLFAEAQEAGLVPAEEQIDQQLGQMRSQFGDPSMFEAALQQQGMTEEELRKGLRMDTAIRQFVTEQIQDTIRVTPEQARTYYDQNPQEFVRPEQVHARHILIQVPPGAPPDSAEAAKQRIDQVRRRLQGGADFAQVAMEVSQDPGSGPRGGDLGFFGPGRMVPPFDSVAFALEAGQLSEPVRTQFGWHLIRVEEKRDAGTFEYPEVEAQLTRRMAGLRTSDRLEALVEELKKDADIKRKI